MNTASLQPVSTQLEVHLSEEAFDEVLMDIAAPEALAHLRVCASCAQRLNDFQQPIAIFNQAALAWSEARSGGLNHDLSAHKPAFRLSYANLRFAGAVAVLAVVFGLHTALHHDASGAAAADSVALASPTEVASDNAMLAAIDSEITPPQPTRFGLLESNHDRGARRGAPTR